MNSPPRFDQTFAIRSSFVLILLTAILVIAYDLSFQSLKYGSSAPRLNDDFDSSMSGVALLDAAENHLINKKYMEAWNTLLYAEDEYRKNEQLALLSRVHWMRAKMLHELKEFDAAFEEIQRSTTLSNRLGLEEYKTESLYLMALNLYSRQKYAAAHQLLESRLQNPNTLPWKDALHFHNLAGLCRERAGDTYEAENHFLTALQFSKSLTPEQYGFLYGNLGHAYAKQGRLNDARKYLSLDIEWSMHNNQHGSAASAAYLLAELMSRSSQTGDKQLAIHYLNSADSLVLHTDLGEINMPSDSLWWSIQRAGALKSGADKDSVLLSSRHALDQMREEENKRMAVRSRDHARGRAQWQEHLAKRNARIQHSGQAISFAAGVILLAGIVLMKPQFR